MGVGGLESRSVLGSNRAEGAEKNVCTKAHNLSGQLDPDYSLAVVRRYTLDQICITHLPGCKCFTYVSKTRANLTTYSRKSENYNGTTIFEIDIMKKSSPINLNPCQT